MVFLKGKKTLLVLGLLFLLSLPFAFLRAQTTPFYFLEASSERSLLLKEAKNQPNVFSSAPKSDFHPLTDLVGASKDAYVDFSNYHTHHDSSLSYGASGSGYWLKQYVGENAKDWGLLVFNIHHPTSLTLGYSIDDNPTSAWRFDFYSEKNGNGSVISSSFCATSYTKKTVTIDVVSLALGYVAESLGFYYCLDSIYSLTFYLNDLTISYLC